MSLEFCQQLKERIALVDGWLEQILTDDADVPAIVQDAMRYSVFAGGKRIRPVLMLAVYEAFAKAGDRQCVMPFACAIEMIHTYSLIHDDLPAMDNSDLRRGRPTSHKVYGEAMALLAGDALLNRAFEVMLSIDNGTDPAVVLKCAGLIGRSAGICGMIGGQVMDMDAEGTVIDFDSLKLLHAKKTGAIIRSAALCGGVLAGVDIEKFRAVDQFARNLGLAFQIKDDILNVVGDSAKLGKPVGNDSRSGKNTYVSLLGLDGAEELLARHTAMAVEAVSQFLNPDAFLIGLSDYLLNREI